MNYMYYVCMGTGWFTIDWVRMYIHVGVYFAFRRCKAFAEISKIASDAKNSVIQFTNTLKRPVKMAILGYFQRKTRPAKTYGDRKGRRSK